MPSTSVASGIGATEALQGFECEHETAVTVLELSIATTDRGDRDTESVSHCSLTLTGGQALDDSPTLLDALDLCRSQQVGEETMEIGRIVERSDDLEEVSGHAW
jgi:hypothetical protein